MKHQTSRRKFIQGTVAAGVTAWGMSRNSSAGVRGANGDIRVAVVGFNGRGKAHLDGLKKVPGVRITALCDVDESVLGKEAAKHKGIATYTDVRKLLDDKEIDAITTATPNHWHSLITIWACQAGKDVYVEKPVSHNIFEGRQMVAAAAKYKRVVQAGTQSRSSTGLHEGIAWLQAGNLGKIKLVRGLCYKPRPSIGKVDGEQSIPKDINYDLWCGPAPVTPLTRKKLHYDWHWVWPTGNGDLGNQGVHQVDIGRWVLGDPVMPTSVMSIGGRLGYVDDGTTPNTMFTCFEHATAPMIFEVRGLKTDKYKGASIGVVVDCEGGRMVIPSYSECIAYDAKDTKVKEFKGGGDHFANWIDAVRTGDTKSLHAHVAVGHLSAASCHAANISLRMGAAEQPEAIAEHIKSNLAAGETYERMSKHLADNGVDLKKTPATFGLPLKIDPAAERFIDNEAANAMLTRPYRAPFVVPTEV